MKSNSIYLKITIGISYLVAISVGLYFLFSMVDIKDLTSYEFIRLNKDIILKYKNENFLFLTAIWFIFTMIWVLFLGFVIPILLFTGFVFGKWWGILIGVTATTIGATLLYVLVNFFFRDFVKGKLEKKFSKLREFFIKNDILYYGLFRFCGGLGAPYAVQNVLPVIFNMSAKSYFIATFFGSVPAMFVTVSLGSGIESVIDQNVSFSMVDMMLSPEIYLPIIAFSIILIVAFLFKKFYFKG